VVEAKYKYNKNLQINFIKYRVIMSRTQPKNYET